MFYAVLTSMVILMAISTSLDVFILGRKIVWTYSVLRNCMYKMKRVTESRQKGIKTWRSFFAIP